MKRRRISRWAALAAAVSATLTSARFSSAQTAGISPVTGQQWVSTFADEFNNGNSDLSGFQYDLGGGGWGNNEKEVYTNSTQNVFVSTTAGVGALNINAIATGSGASQTYTSGRIRTNALFSQGYGLFEFRAKFPSGTGLWPALWMMPENSAYGGWPTSGEIDVFESMGNQPTLVQGSLHSGTSPGTQDTQTQTFTGAGKEPAGFSTGDWHTYDLQWIPGSKNQAGTVKWYVDGILYESQTAGWVVPGAAPAGDKDAPFDKSFYILMNMAVGGNYVGNTVSLNAGSYAMQVDDVRVYQSLFAGDADENGTVNAADFNTVAAHFNSTGATWQQGDFNGDGIVNAADFALLADHYGKSAVVASGAPALGTVVPEPTSLALLALAPIARRRRK